METIRLHVAVTWDHMRRGAAASTTACPIALALRDAACAAGLEPLEWSVGPLGLGLKLAAPGRTYWNAGAWEDVRRWIWAWEHNQDAEPFEFDLELSR